MLTERDRHRLTVWADEIAEARGMAPIPESGEASVLMDGLLADLDAAVDRIKTAVSK